MTFESLLKQAMILSERDRQQLADELWKSIRHEDSDLALTPAQSRDLKSRLEEDAAGGSDPQDWEQVRDDLQRQK
jgi:putative addiction module component (TIGR02574 family)